MSDEEYNDLCHLNDQIKEIEDELTSIRMRESSLSRRLDALNKIRQQFIVVSK